MATHAEIAQRPTYALVMCGNEFRHLHPAQLCEEHFREKVKLPPEKVRVIRCAYRDQESTLQEMHDFLVKPSKTEPTNIILTYIGHGDIGYMVINNENAIYYKEIACLLREHNGNFVFLNSSCHSGSSIDVIVARGLHKKGLTLTSVAADELSSGDAFVRECFNHARPPAHSIRQGTWACLSSPCRR